MVLTLLLRLIPYLQERVQTLGTLGYPRYSHCLFRP